MTDYDARDTQNLEPFDLWKGYLAWKGEMKQRYGQDPNANDLLDNVIEPIATINGEKRTPKGRDHKLEQLGREGANEFNRWFLKDGQAISGAERWMRSAHIRRYAKNYFKRLYYDGQSSHIEGNLEKQVFCKFLLSSFLWYVDAGVPPSFLEARIHRLSLRYVHEQQQEGYALGQQHAWFASLRHVAMELCYRKSDVSMQDTFVTVQRLKNEAAPHFEEELAKEELTICAVRKVLRGKPATTQECLEAFDAGKWGMQIKQMKLQNRR